MGMADYDDNLYGAGDMAFFDSLEWYEVTQGEQGEPRARGYRKYSVGGTIIEVYNAQDDYGSVVIKVNGNLNSKLLDCLYKIKCIQDKVHKYLYVTTTDTKEVIGTILKIADLPRIKTVEGNGLFFIVFESEPPARIKKRLRDFKFRYSNGAWAVNEKQTDSINKVKAYLKNQGY